MPLAHGLELVGYEALGNGAFRVGDLIARPFADNLEWGLGRIEGSLASPEQTQRVGRLAVASLQEVAKSEDGHTTCTDGRFPLLLFTNRLHPVRRQLLANNIGTGLMMAETLGGDYYEDPTVPIDKRIETVAEDLEVADAHEDCGGLAGFPVIMGNVVEFSTKHPGYQSRTEQTLGDEFNPDTFHSLVGGLKRHLETKPYLRYGPDIVWRAVQQKTGKEGLMQVHSSGPDGIHGHQEKIILWLRESITDLALNQRLLSELGDGTGGAQAFGINQSEMLRIAQIIGKNDPERVSKAMHAGAMGTHAGHGTLAFNMPAYLVERVA